MDLARLQVAKLTVLCGRMGGWDWVTQGNRLSWDDRRDLGTHRGSREGDFHQITGASRKVKITELSCMW